MAKSFGLSYPQTEPFNFLGLEREDWQKAKIAILPVPYSSTTYWSSGTQDGPRAIIEASRHLELYDQELERDISKVGIYTLPEVEVSKNSPKETIERITKIISQILKDKKFPLMLGGEHSISLAGVTSAARKFNNFSVLQLDAHTDSRFEFEGTKYHHGCVMRRVVEDVKVAVTHVGIRSLSWDEMRFLKKSKMNKVFFAPELPVEQIMATLLKNVYITIDLDVFDTSLMPSVGTPEPGGLSWYVVLELLKKVAAERVIVGADIVELDPIPGMVAPNFTAAKLAYKLIGYITAE